MIRNIPSFSCSQAFYKSLRVHQDKTFLDIANRITFYKLIQHDFVVKNAQTSYNISKKLLGKSITDFFVKNTVGKLFSAGETKEEIFQAVKHLEQQNIKSMIVFAAEGVSLADPKSHLDYNSLMFENGVEWSSQMKMYISAVKFSAIVPMEILRYLTDKCKLIQHIYDQSDKQQTGKITLAQLKESLEQNNIKTEEQELIDFATQILNLQNPTLDSEISKVLYQSLFHPFYCTESNKNDNSIISKIADLSPVYKSQLSEMVFRMNKIVRLADKLNSQILVDAEQTYLQPAIDTFAIQYQFEYNKNKQTIINTFQCYLKSSIERVQFEIEKCKLFNLPLCIKIVRGAYVVEETNLSRKLKYQNPICETYEKTTESYHRNVNILLENYVKIKGSKVLFGTHNEGSINYIQDKMAKLGIKKEEIILAQLMGLVDHVTISLQKQGYPVFKLIPFAKSDIMVPWFIRRAQEQSQTRIALSNQIDLLKDELYHRWGLKS